MKNYGAGGGIRTRDLNLGKVALYQLSYTRLKNRFLIPFKPCKYNKVIHPCQQKSIFVSIDGSGGLWYFKVHAR